MHIHVHHEQDQIGAREAVSMATCFFVNQISNKHPEIICYSKSRLERQKQSCPFQSLLFFSPRVVTHTGDNTISYTSFHNRSNTLSCTPERKEEVSIHNLSGTYRVAAQRGFEAYGDFTRRCSYSFVGLLCIIDGFASSRRSARDLSMETRCRVFFVHRNMRSKYCTAS